MAHSPVSPVKIAIGVLALTAMLVASGCGRRGPLEAPPGSVSPAPAGSAQDEAAPPVEEDRRIILDALI